MNEHNANRDSDQYARYCNDVALLLYGTPNRDKCTSTENRWGTNGSLSVKLATGEWYDFEARKGGSTLELIMHHFEHMESKDAAIEWFNLVRDKLTNGAMAPHSGNSKANGGDAGRELTFEGAAEHYPYQNAEGEVAFVAARYEPKDFRPWRRGNRGDWILGLDGVKLVPYRLPELIEAVASGHTIHVLEGERDVETARNLGLVATCNQGGTGQGWKEEYNEWFRGADVVVHCDNDDAGRKHQGKVADALRGVAKRVRYFDLKRHWPAMPHKGDLTDWVRSGGKREELDRFIEREFADKLPFINFSDWDDVPVPRQEWAVSDRIPTEQVTLFSGEGAAGKSLVQLQLSVAHVLGKEWLGIVPELRPAWFIDAEDGEKIIHKRLADILRYYDATFAAACKRGLHLTTLAGQDAVLASVSKSGKIEPTPLYHELLEKAGDIKPAMIGIASSANVFAGNEISRTEVQQFIALLTRIAMVGRSAVNLISHPSLTGISSGTGLSGSTQWHNAVRARFYLRNVKAKKKGDDDEEPDHNVRVLEFHKNNYGPVSSRILLRYDGGLFLPYHGEDVGQIERQLQAAEVFLAVLTKLTAQGFDLSPHKTSPSGWAPNIIAKDPDAAGFRKRDMEAAMQRLLDLGRIHIAERGSGARARKYLFPGPKPTEA